MNIKHVGLSRDTGFDNDILNIHEELNKNKRITFSVSIPILV
jgi:hypothetical protein